MLSLKNEVSFINLVAGIFFQLVMDIKMLRSCVKIF